MLEVKILKKIYNYRDEKGNVVAQTLRYEPKSFRQRRPYGNGYIWGLREGWYKQNNSCDYILIKECVHKPDNLPPHTGAIWFKKFEPVLYRLPELLSAILRSETIFIVEGEDDADNLANFGFPVTTCPMGAGKWRKSYTEILKPSKRIVILSDNDEPGLRHAEELAKEFHINAEVKVIRLPHLNGSKVKDISDWIRAGGSKSDLHALIRNCHPWKLPQNDASDLIQEFGDPYYLSPKGTVSSINEGYWAGLHNTENTQLYESEEKTFYRYNSSTGLYKEISTDAIKQEISKRILLTSRELALNDLEKKRTNGTLNNIVGHLKGICEKEKAFSRKDKKIVHLGNGVIEFQPNGKANLVRFSPEFYSRNQCPIPYDKNAQCPRFLYEFLYPAISKNDALMLQKYTGLCLLGNNLIQRFVILDGKPKMGKSTLISIIQKFVGLDNVTELRTRHLSERFELYRYRKKTLLIGVDVPGRFLSERGAHVIKGLVGGDWFDAEKKCGVGNYQVLGNYCILITSNSRLQVKLDGDIGAWKRRLLIVRFEGSLPQKSIPYFDDVLIKQEGSGILNWALKGLDMLYEDIAQYGDICLTTQQAGVVDTLLAESDSLRNFLKECVERNNNSDLTVSEIVEAYAEYCPAKGWNPKPITIVQKELEGLVLELFSTAKSQSIKRDGRSVRGFRRLALKEPNESGY